MMREQQQTRRATGAAAMVLLTMAASCGSAPDSPATADDSGEVGELQLDATLRGACSAKILQVIPAERQPTLQGGIAIQGSGDCMGGITPEYRFSAKWRGITQVLCDWQSASTCNLDSAPVSESGYYTLILEVRRPGQLQPDAATTRIYAFGPVCTEVALAAIPLACKQVALVVSAAQCDAGTSPEFAFQVARPDGGWRTFAGYQASAFATWQPANFAPGRTHFRVLVRRHGATSIDLISAKVPHDFGLACTATSLTVAGKGSSRTITARSECSTIATPEYRFRLEAPNGTSSVLRDWDYSNIVPWDVSAVSSGSYGVTADVRAVEHRSQPVSQIHKEVSVGTPCSITIAPLPTLPVNRAVQFSTTSTCASPELQFRVRAETSQVWTTACNFGSSNACSWTPPSDSPLGKYYVEVQARQTGGTIVQAKKSMLFELGLPSSTGCVADATYAFRIAGQFNEVERQGGDCVPVRSGSYERTVQVNVVGNSVEVVDEPYGFSGTYPITQNTPDYFIASMGGDGLSCGHADLSLPLGSVMMTFNCASNTATFEARCESGILDECERNFVETASGTGSPFVDIDECATGQDNCDANADCTNTFSGFTCQCKPGYGGDGFSCEDFNSTGPWTAVDAGGSHSCGLRADGGIACWGSLTTAPNGTFSSVSAGGDFSCALTTAGAITCWGANSDGQTTAPAGTFSSVSAGARHSCALRQDGSIVCWGSNSLGQTAVPSGTFTSVSAGDLHTCGVRSDGSVACWGWNGYGQASVPSGNYSSVSAGSTHTCALRADQTVICWGAGGFGEATPPSGTFASVSAGLYHTCGLRTDGTLACWGANGANYGQAAAPSGAFVSVSAGSYHSCGVLTNGAVQCWGCGSGTGPAQCIPPDAH